MKSTRSDLDPKAGVETGAHQDVDAAGVQECAAREEHAQ